MSKNINKFDFSINGSRSEVLVEWNYDEFDNVISEFLSQSFNCSIEENRGEILFGNFLLNYNLIAKFLSIYPDLRKIAYMSDDLRAVIENIPKYKDVIDNPFTLSNSEIENRLKEKGFIRTLKPYQLRNVAEMIKYPSAASFSVPGAGKTTEALAFFTLKKKNKFSKLFIISPINAFTAWDDEIPSCLEGIEGHDNFRVTRLRDDIEENTKKINLNKNFYIVNYEKIRTDPSFLKLMTKELNNLDKEYFVVLDESHKMKGVQTNTAVNFFSPLVKNKLILSGTPMPQSYGDLIPQFRFLYPRENYNDETDKVVESFKHIFVRTTKEDIGLPPAKEFNIEVELSGVQKEIYDIIASSEARKKYDFSKKREIKEFKVNMMRLLQFCSNPYLQQKFIEGIDPDISLRLQNSNEIYGTKMERLIYDAENFCNQKREKLIIWSSFPKNIDIICEKLAHLNPAKVHGGIDAETREENIEKFKKNDNCMVFVANPAAASEGISLHKVCRNAYYLDRSFNVAHYLQSKDRIHRIGSDEKEDINIRVYQLGKGTIDHRVNTRLEQKINVMANFLNDPSIKPNPKVLNEESIFDYERSNEEKEKDFINDFCDNEDIIDFYSSLKDQYNV